MDNNDPSQIDPPSEVYFVILKEDEAVFPLIRKDVLSKEEEVRKHGMSPKEGLESQAMKMLKVSNLNFPSGKVGDTVKLQVSDVDRARSNP